MYAFTDLQRQKKKLGINIGSKAMEAKQVMTSTVSVFQIFRILHDNYYNVILSIDIMLGRSAQT